MGFGDDVGIYSVIVIRVDTTLHALVSQLQLTVVAAKRLREPV